MKKLLFTGSNGFLGKNILPLLQKNCQVKTLDLHNADYCCNLANEIPDINEKFDIVLHAVGKAHSVPTTEEEKKQFFDINYSGTVNLCKSFEKSKNFPDSFIFISTVAVYGCSTGENIDENYPLNGEIPYALSKIQAENFLTDWAKKNSVILSVLRPSLIAGTNPPGNLGAMIDGIKKDKYLSIGKANAQKSILMAHDIANLIPALAEKGGIYNICDSQHPTFRQLENLIVKQLDKSTIITIPFFVAKILAKTGDCFGQKFPINSAKLIKITQSLTFSNEKAKKELNWQPLNVLENFKIS